MSRVDRWVAGCIVVAAMTEAVMLWHGRPLALAADLCGALVFGSLALRTTEPTVVRSCARPGWSQPFRRMDQRPEAHAGAGLLAFEIDFGEGWTGHRLVATGLRLDGTSDDPVHADYSEHHDGKPVHPMVSVTYRVTPALRTSMLAGREVYAQVRLAPAADRAHWPAVLEPGEERDCTPGAGVTHGAFGPFVLPDGTREVRISLTNVAVTTDGVPPADDSPSRPLGSLVIDLSSAAAHWEPS